MRALNVPASGAQPIFSDLPTPEVGPGSVLVKVKAAGLNAVDNLFAAGHMADMMPHEYPLVLGRDIGEIIPFDKARDGLATIANGHARGKIVVSLDGR